MFTVPPQAQPAHVVHLLLVDDDEARVQHVREMLQRGRITNPLRVLGPDEAMVFLRHAPPSHVRRLILLNIGGPQMQIFKMLRELRRDPQLDGIPVVALFSTNLEKEQLDTVNLHVDGYLPRPLEPDAFMALLARLHRSWSWVSSLESEMPS